MLDILTSANMYRKPFHWILLEEPPLWAVESTLSWNSCAAKSIACCNKYIKHVKLATETRNVKNDGVKCGYTYPKFRRPTIPEVRGLVPTC